MAIALICDGCGAPTSDAEAHKIGRVIVRDYCPACSEAAQTFMQRLDDAHTKACEAFEGARRCAIETAAPLKMLPDVPA